MKNCLRIGTLGASLFVLCILVTGCASPGVGTKVEANGQQSVDITDGKITHSTSVYIQNMMSEGKILAAKDLYSTVGEAKSFEVSVPTSAFAAIAGAVTPSDGGNVTLKMPQQQSMASETISVQRLQQIQATRLQIIDSQDVRVGNIGSSEGTETGGNVIVELEGSGQKVAVDPTNVLSTKEDASKEVKKRIEKGAKPAILKAKLFDPLTKAAQDVFVSLPETLFKGS